MPLLGQWAARQPEKPAAIFADSGETISFASLDAAAHQAALWFVAEGFAPGEGIALLLENEPDFLALSYTESAVQVRDARAFLDAHGLKDVAIWAKPLKFMLSTAAFAATTA